MDKVDITSLFLTYLFSFIASRCKGSHKSEGIAYLSRRCKLRVIWISSDFAVGEVYSELFCFILWQFTHNEVQSITYYLIIVLGEGIQ